MYFNLYLTVYNLLLTACMIAIVSVCMMIILARRGNIKAGRFLVMFLALNFLWLFGIIARDINLESYYPLIRFIPFTLSLALGPSIYFYIRATVQPPDNFKTSDWLHFAPLLLHFLAISIYGQEIRADGLSDKYQGNLYEVINPFIELLTIGSILFYLRKCRQVVSEYHNWLNRNYSNPASFSAGFLLRDVRSYGLAWLLWLPFAGYDYLLHNYELPPKHYYAVYLLIACCAIWIGFHSILKPILIPVMNSEQQINATESIEELPDSENDDKMDWIKEQMSKCKYYLDPDLSLRVLAEELGVHHNTLTRLINKGSGKNFNDFINQFRIDEVKRKIVDPTNAHLTIEAVAYESGFNSKATFNRNFKKITGMTPREYLRTIRKEQVS